MQALQMQSVTWQGAECALVRGEDAEHVSYEIWIAPDSVRHSGMLWWPPALRSWFGGTGDAAHRFGHSAVWRGHPRARSAAGDGTGARFELQQGMLRWAGDRRAHSVAGSGASEVHGICQRKARRRSRRDARLLPEKKKLERLPAPLPCSWRAETRRWRWDISGAKWACRDVR